MTIRKRLAALEKANNTDGEQWLIHLLEELAAARSEGREPAPRQPSIKENTAVVLALKKHGINNIIDDGGCEW